MLIALCFAEVGSRFEGTGGPYLYTRAAFGRFAAFEVGWLMWFTRVASWASVINVLVSVARVLLARDVAERAPRRGDLTVIIAAIAAINVRGIRQSSLVLNVLTVAKLTPLVIFIVVGSVRDRPVASAPAAARRRCTSSSTSGAPADLRVRRLRGRAGSGR